MSGHNELSSPQLEPTTTVSSPPMSLATGQEGLAAVSKQAICEFLDRLNFTFPEYKRDLELEARVNEATRGRENGEYMRPYVVTAILITVMAYGHLSSIDAKLAVALYTALLVALDDPAVFDSLSAQKLPFRLCAGSAQRDGDVLGELSRNLAGMWGIYPDFAASAVCTSALRFVNACFLENMGTDAMLRPGMRSFVDYQRGMSGVADAYACFIWEKARFPDVTIYLEAMLDAMLFIGRSNDVLSFYKEELAGETGNYIHDCALVTGESVLHTLQHLIDDILAALARVRTVLGEGEAREAWEDFAAGYVYFHILSSRYRLNDVLEDQCIVDLGLS